MNRGQGMFRVLTRYPPGLVRWSASPAVNPSVRRLRGRSDCLWSLQRLAKPRARSRRSARPRSRTARSRLLARPRSRMARRPPFTRPSRPPRPPLLASLRFAATPPEPRSRTRLLAPPSPGHRAFSPSPAITVPPQQLSLGQRAPPSETSRLRARNLRAARGTSHTRRRWSPSAAAGRTPSASTRR